MLLDDERHVIKWLSQYGALTKTQVIRLLRDKTPETAEKILRNLKREHQISDVAGGYYLALDGLCKPDQRTILAVWVLLRFIDYVDPMAHYPAVYPSQIFFLKENTGYSAMYMKKAGRSGGTGIMTILRSIWSPIPSPCMCLRMTRRRAAIISTAARPPRRSVRRCMWSRHGIFPSGWCWSP